MRQTRTVLMVGAALSVLLLTAGPDWLGRTGPDVALIQAQPVPTPAAPTGGSGAQELLERLLQQPASGPSNAVRLLPGAWPADLPVTVPLPPAGQLIGSAEWTELAGRTIEGVLDAPGSPGDTIAFYSQALPAAGWTTPVSPRGSPGAGAAPTGPVVPAPPAAGAAPPASGSPAGPAPAQPPIVIVGSTSAGQGGVPHAAFCYEPAQLRLVVAAYPRPGDASDVRMRLSPSGGGCVQIPPVDLPGFRPPGSGNTPMGGATRIRTDDPALPTPNPWSFRPPAAPQAPGDLLRVVAIGQSATREDVQVDILSLEVYAAGFQLNTRVLYPLAAGFTHQYDFTLVARDDRGNRYEAAGPGAGSGGRAVQGGYEMRSGPLFTPPLDPAATTLTLEADHIRFWELVDPATGEVALVPGARPGSTPAELEPRVSRTVPGPWTFTIPLVPK